MITAKIVTDSVADLPSEVAEELGITVIPILVRLGEGLYSDGIDLTAEQFYEKLKRCRTLPLQNDSSNRYPYRFRFLVGSRVGG